MEGESIEAHSEGGIETCIQLPARDLAFDIGRCPPGAERVSQLFLTHAHIDHAAGLPYYVSLRSMLGMPPPTVYCPAESQPTLQAILDLWAKLQADTDRVTLVGVSPGDEIAVKRGKMRVFRAPHRIAAVGYTLWQTRRHLRADLVGTPPNEIARLAAAGHDVSTTTEEPIISFPGDTRAALLDTEPSVMKARILLLECTFVGPDVDAEKASRSGHIHLDQIAERANRFENKALVLTHFSRRYGRRHIEKAVRDKLPDELFARTRLLIHHD